ncbi:cyclin-A1-1-like [Hibiscus syriacus]|uniref:cyclin-A1-1-like n=1 Tax=Hibiscus syriacus TaxID=106335 RepID=UPI0019211A05|nr:cyclin-A1-1-like [Hibiscus syriacus]
MGEGSAMVAMSEIVMGETPPSSSTFDALEYIEELYTPSSLERAQVVQDFDDQMPTSIRHLEDVYVSETDSNETDGNSIPEMIALGLEIYKNLGYYAILKRPSKDYMKTVQIDINVEMRASLINLLVRVTEMKKLLLRPETLCLTVSYIDRYLSNISINSQQLQLLGLACMMIAWKYVSLKATPKVPVWCHVTGKSYLKDEMLQMESAVLYHLKYEMAVPTAYNFLRHVVWVAETRDRDHLLQLKCLASYIVQLSLLDYAMLRYAPQQVAASAGFLARFILSPSDKPWDAKLREYTLYQPSDLEECVKALHLLYRDGGGTALSAIAAKYSQSKYCSVSKRECPATIPEQFFWAV